MARIYFYASLTLGVVNKVNEGWEFKWEDEGITVYHPMIGQKVFKDENEFLKWVLE